MASAGKNTSTERLLEIIRGKGKSAAGSTGAADGSASKRGRARAATPAKSGSRKKSFTVGVDIGPDSLRIAKMGGTPGRPKLLGIKHSSYAPGAAPGEAGFPGFMQARLREFCGSTRTYDVWALVSSAKAELWHITIPKVPRSQIEEAVFWTVKKEKQFDEKEFILDFEVQGELSEKGVPKLAVMVYLAPRKQVDDAKRLFSQAGVKLAGITISPIAIQTLFRTKWVQATKRTYAHLYIGRNWSRIDIFMDTNLVLSRGIKAGTNSMVEALMENYNMMERQRNPGAELTMEEPVIALSLDDDSAGSAATSQAAPAQLLELDDARELLRQKLMGLPGSKTGRGLELSEKEVIRMVRPAVERLVRQVERTFEYHTTTMGKDRVESIFFSGDICTNRVLIEFINSQLGIDYQLLDPLDPSIPALSSVSADMTVVDRLSCNLVIALALCDDANSPNLLFTYKEREKQRQAQRVDMAIYAFSGLVLLCLVGVWLWQRTLITARQTELISLQQEAGQYQPKATRDVLISMATKVRDNNMTLKRASRKYESLSALSELSQLTPDYIKVLSLTMDFGVLSDLDLLAKPGAVSPTKTLVLDGVVLGNIETFEPALTSYLIRLENSPLFQMPVIHKRSVEDFIAGKVLRFVIHITLV